MCPRPEIFHGRPKDAQIIQPLVAVEISVLGGEKGLPDMLWNGFHWNDGSSLIGNIGNELAIIGVNASRLGRLIVFKGFKLGKALGDIKYTSDGAEEPDHSHCGEPLQQTRYFLPLHVWLVLPFPFLAAGPSPS